MSFHHFQTLTTVDCVLLSEEKIFPVEFCLGNVGTILKQTLIEPVLIDAVNWDILLQCSSGNIDDLWHLWYEKFMSILEECIYIYIPQSTIQNNRSLPWVTKSIRRKMKIRNYYWKKSKTNTSYLPKYRKLRNEVVSMLHFNKKRFVQNVRPTNTKAFWITVKLLRGKTTSSIPVLYDDGQPITSNEDKANILNQFFCSCFNSALPPLSSDPVRFHHDTNTCPEYLMCNEEEVMDIIWRLDVSKASGPDQISVRILKGTVGSISPILAGLFNKMIKHEKIPSVWKISNIVPIPKGSNSTSPSNYRPISLLSVVSKVLEKIIYNRVAKNLESLCPPPSNQWGFLPQRSTTSAFIKVTDDWLIQLEEGNEVAAIFFDIKKAFDSVPH